jgi:hypothetical protein
MLQGIKIFIGKNLYAIMQLQFCRNLKLALVVLILQVFYGILLKKQ